MGRQHTSASSSSHARKGTTTGSGYTSLLYSRDVPVTGGLKLIKPPKLWFYKSKDVDVVLTATEGPSFVADECRVRLRLLELAGSS